MFSGASQREIKVDLKDAQVFTTKKLHSFSQSVNNRFLLDTEGVTLERALGRAPQIKQWHLRPSWWLLIQQLPICPAFHL